VIHVIFVPVIWWSAVLLFCSSGPLVELPEVFKKVLPAFIADNLVLNAGFFIGFVGYSAYYMYLGDYVVAIPYNIFLFFLYLSASATYQALSAGKLALVILAAQAAGWGSQVIIGHNIIEGRKAALLDSLFDALIMAPLFTWYELLFFFGFRSEFKKRLQVRVNERIAELDKKNGATKATVTVGSPTKSSEATPRKHSVKGSRKTD